MEGVIKADSEGQLTALPVSHEVVSQAFLVCSGPGSNRWTWKDSEVTTAWQVLGTSKEE